MASRFFHRAIDGTIPYFSSEGGMQEEGRLPEGADPSELMAQGYQEADRDTFLRERALGDPTRVQKARPISQATIDERAKSFKNWMAANPELAAEPVLARGIVPEDPDTEDAALSELAGAMDYAGLGKPAPVPVPTMPGTGNRRPPSRAVQRGDTPADVDALGAAFDDFYNRANAVDVQNVPSTVQLASSIGGQPLPGPTQRSAMASPQPGPEQGPVFGEADTLQDAQKRSALMRGLAGAGKGMSRIGAAIAGVRPESGAAADMERGADAQVRDYLQRKQQADAERATTEQAALKDPASPQSQRFQALVSRAFGSVYTPEQISQMTAADAPLVGQYGQMVRTLEDRAAGRAAEQEAQQAQLTARATEAEKQRAFEAKQNAANRANAREIAGMRQGAAGDKADEAFQRKMSERNVGGFEIDPANPPTAEGAKKMASVVDAREQIKGSLDRLENLFNKYGTEMGGGGAQSLMESELGNITTQLRLFNQMGVPNMNDYTELAKQIPQTAGVGAWFTREGTIRPKFKALRDQLDRAVSATANTYKFRPTGGPQRVGMQGNMDLSAAQRVPVKSTPSKDGTKVRIDYSDGTSEVKDAA